MAVDLASVCRNRYRNQSLAPDYESGGREFESLRARQPFNRWNHHHHHLLRSLAPMNNVSSLAVRPLGRTGVDVTRLGLGTAPLGENWDIIEEGEAGAVLEAAWDGGVRYFDTSPWYGKGQAEHRVGRALYRKPRDQFVISSKVGRTLRRPLKSGPFERGDWLGGLEFDAVFDYSYDCLLYTS